MLGNCLFGALWLMLWHCTLRLRVCWGGSGVPHFLVLAPDGYLWHFKVHRDILPMPLAYLLFVGRLERVRG